MNHVFYGVNVADCKWKDGLIDIFQKGIIYSKALGRPITLYDVLFRQFDPKEIDLLSDEYPNVSAYLDSMELDVGANSGNFSLELNHASVGIWERPNQSSIPRKRQRNSSATRSVHFAKSG